MSITEKRLKEVISYCPDSGVFHWVVSNSPRVSVGDVAGGYQNKGYRTITIDGKAYLAHRLAFLYMTGVFPESHTDHINGVRDDNRFENLRSVTQAENNKNRRKNKDNKSGFTGVSWDKASSKWKAQIRYSGQKIHLGYFDDLEDAVIAREAGNIKYGYHKNHGQFKELEQ
tara:strand:- start:197 stop:709 length:513 start_codon:yes stop_codon:yes gene_type:complete